MIFLRLAINKNAVNLFQSRPQKNNQPKENFIFCNIVFKNKLIKRHDIIEKKGKKLNSF